MSRPRRPFSVTLSALGVLSIAAINLVRLTQAITGWDFLRAHPPLSPLYLALSGLIWTIVLPPLAWGLWRGSARARRRIPLVALVYSVYYWLNRLLLFPDAGGSNWPFALSLNILLLVWLRWMLTREGAKTYFGEPHDR